jgi:hypothetical protein
MNLKYPIKLRLEASELGKNQWKLSYAETFRPEDITAFKNAMQYMQQTPNLNVTLDEKRSVAKVEILDSREAIFSFLCGEFFGLSGVGQIKLQELFILAGIGLAKHS